MAATTVSPPPHTAEATSSPTPSYQDLSPPTQAPPDSPNLETLTPPSPSPLPLFLNSITELKHLYAAMSDFLQRYEDLNMHLETIKSAISAKLPLETPRISASSPQKSDILEETSIEEINPLKSELEGLCKAMCSRGVRKYMVSHLSNLAMLREEVPKALRQAGNPSKLVLECLGKFFLQGSRAFTRDSPMIPAREASILILECFLLMMGLDEEENGMLKINKEVKEEADVAALAWRKRLMVEGGLPKANQIDARGLLLFVACFGEPSSFKADDIRDLVIAGNAKEIAGVLQKSQVLMKMIEEMMKKKKEVCAVDIVYTLGLEERFNPQKILVSFLRESKENWKKAKKAAQGSPATLNEANKKQLTTLKSISRCLEKHNVDPSKLLPGWQINEKIATLEKDTADFERKSGDRTSQKRKTSETEASTKTNVQEAKRMRNFGQGLHQHKAGAHVDSRRNHLDSHVNGYGAPAVVYGGPGAGLLPESMVPSGVGTSAHGGIHPTYGVHEGVLVDATGQLVNRGLHHYPWPRDSGINERYSSQPPPLGLTNLYRASPSLEGFPGNTTSSELYGSRGSASDLYHFADSVPESTIPRSSAAVPSHLWPAHP